jgi:phosphoesterase RecJ-like protein
VDVSAVAAHFGGGGHARAAGLRSTLPFEQVYAQVVEACQAALRRPGASG